MTQAELQQIKLLYPNARTYFYSIKFIDTDIMETVLDILRTNRPEHIEIQYGTDRVYFIYINYKDNVLLPDETDVLIDRELSKYKLNYNNELLNTRQACFLVKIMNEPNSLVFDNLIR